MIPVFPFEFSSNPTAHRILELISMNPATRDDKLAELHSLRARVQELETELEGSVGENAEADNWRERGNYITYYATTGFFLGMLGALASLLANVLGAIASNLPPLKLIQVYLTFGMGETALDPSFTGARAEIALLIGCILYVGTGMCYGVVFQIIFNKYYPKATTLERLWIATFLGLLLWLVNFYVLIAFLQSFLFGGNWIAERIPWWVGAGTHLVFAWTMALMYPLGAFVPYRPREAPTVIDA
jgi:hypothetical protein